MNCRGPSLTGGTPENIDLTCDASKEKVIYRKPLLLAGFGKHPFEAARADRDIHPIPVVKLFTPGGYAHYLLTEIDPTHSDRAYGLCVNRVAS